MESWHAICSVAHVAGEQEIRSRIQQLPSKARRLASRDVNVALLACHRAIQSNPDVGVARAFLEQREVRQNVNQCVFPEKSTTLLHSAVLRLDGGESIVKMLLGLAEVDLNLVAFRSGLTPLHLACLLSRCEVVELLLNDRRVDVSAKSVVGNWTALLCACGALDDELEFVDWDRKNVDSTVRILLKAAATSTGSLLRFLDEKDRRGRTALHYASENNHRSILQEIFTSLKLVSGPRIHQSAAYQSSTQLCAAKTMLESQTQVIEDSWSTPSDEHSAAVVLAQDSKGLMPVHLAAQMGHREMVAMLLRCAPRTLHSKDAGGLTPLHHAVQGGHLQIMAEWVGQYVLKSDSEQKIVARFMELLKIATHSEVAIFLLAELDQRLQASSPTRRAATSLLHWVITGSGGTSSLVPQILKWHPALANEVLDHAGKLTPLHMSTISGRHDLVETLCREDGWSLRANTEDRFNKTALDYAHDLGYKEICEHLMQRSDVKECLFKLRDELSAHVAAANAILVVAVLIAGALFANCIKPLTIPTTAPTMSSIVISSTIFLTSISATILGTCAASPFSFWFCGGKYANRSEYIGYRLRRIRVLLELASYFLLVSLANMVFGFLCNTFVAVRASPINCTAFAAAFACIMVSVFVTCVCRALYHRFRHRSMWWNYRKSSSKLVSLDML